MREMHERMSMRGVHKPCRPAPSVSPLIAAVGYHLCLQLLRVIVHRLQPSSALERGWLCVNVPAAFDFR
jgi:hypothetical protein